MKKITKLLTFIGILLLIIGSAIFVKAFADADWKFVNLTPNKLQNRVVEIEGEFDNISLELDTTDVEFVLLIHTSCKNSIRLGRRFSGPASHCFLCLEKNFCENIWRFHR